MTNIQDTKIPLTIGMIGHRDIPEEDVPALKQSIQQILDEIQQQFPNTPLMCVTSLADGADQIAFDISKENNLQTMAILPMPHQDYLEDFQDDPTRFETRWEQADYTYELPWLKGKEQRNTQYDAAAFTIATNVHFLIVLWDGKDVGLQGGTGETVKFRLNPELPEDEALRGWLNFSDDILKSPETGPLIHIQTRRKKDMEQDIKVGQTEWHIPEQLQCDKDQFYSILGDHERLNEDLIKEEHIKQDEYQQLISADELSKLEETPVLVKHFSILDTLAVKFSKLRRCFLIVTIVCSWFVLVFYELYGNYSFTVFIGLYLFSIITAWGLFTMLSKLYWQDRFFDYRAYAEALRVQFFWRRYGINMNVADHCIADQTTDLAWIRMGLRTSYLLGMCDKTLKPSKDEVRERWVQGQRSYFTKSRVRDFKKMQRYKQPIPYFLAGAVLFALLHYFEATSFGNLSEDGLLLLLSVSVLMPTFAVMLGFLIEVEGYEEHINEYEKMSGLYSKAEQALKDLPETKHEDVIISLGKKALEENSYWLSLHRTKRLQVVM